MPNLLCVTHEWELENEEMRQLADSGYRVIRTTNGFDAIKHFATGEVDAVVVNRRLPDISVADLATYFRHHKNLPIVMVSTSMPVRNVPSAVDAVIGRPDCGNLLTATLQVLLKETPARPDDERFARVA